MSGKLTLEQIQQTIKSAKDSVWVIEDSVAKLASGAIPTTDLHNSIESNTNHLKRIVTNVEIIESGEDISELKNGIALGTAKLAENIWPAK